MVAGFSRAVDVDRTAEHEAWRILFRRRARSAERKLSQFRARHHTDLSATAPCEATIQNLIPVVIPRLDALRASDDAMPYG